MAIGAPAITGADGQFTARDVTAGEYVIRVVPQRTAKERIIEKFAEKDLKLVDEDYQASYWPGGYGPDSAIPVLLSSGATVDVGRIRAKRVPYYRLHVRIPAGACGPGDTMMVYESTPGVMATLDNQQPCSPEMLIAGFPAGAYRLVLAVNKRTPETRETASIPFVIKDENVELIAPLERGVEVDVTFTTAEGAAQQDLSKVQLSFNPIEAMPMADIAGSKSPDANGNVRFVGIPAVSQRIMLNVLPPGAYVKEIRYNGSVVNDLIMPLSRLTPDHSLTIVIDDKPAAVAGVVTERDNPVSKAYVILAKWPLPSADSPYHPQVFAADEKGRFQFAGLAPGEYRILALRSQLEYDDSEPGVLERALAVAKKLELGPSTFENTTIGIGSLK